MAGWGSTNNIRTQKLNKGKAKDFSTDSIKLFFSMDWITMTSKSLTTYIKNSNCMQLTDLMPMTVL